MCGFVSTLGLTLLHFLWQGALIGAAAVVALRFSARRTAQHRYLICMVALLACAVTPCVTAVVLMLDDPSISRLDSSSSLLLRQIETPLLAVRWAGASRSLDLISATVALWMVGVLAVIAYYGLQWRGVERIRRSAVPLPSQQRVAEIARNLLQRWQASAVVPVMMATSITTPIVIGLWRPMIVFPAAMIARMPTADFELILLHEIAHIVRRDSWANALQVCLEILFFYHPLVHWLSWRARLERERACDDFAIAASGSAYRYARALTSLMIVSGRVPATALGAAGADLLPRLRYLTGQCRDHDEFPRSPLILALIVLLLFGIGTVDPRPWGGLADTLSDAPSMGSQAEPVVLEWPLARTENISPRDSLPRIVAESTPSLATTARRIKPQQSVAPRTAHVAEVSPPVELAAVPVETEVTSGTVEPTRTEPAPLPPVEELALPPQSAGLTSPPDLSEPDPTLISKPTLTATYSPLPEYPGLARLEGIEGTVSVVLRVAPDGRPADLRIIHAEPLGVFEGAVRRALMKWRYDVPSTADSSAQMAASYQLRFSIAGVTSDAAPVCVTMTASNTCRPL